MNSLTSPEHKPENDTAKTEKDQNSFRIIAIGASAGGLEALQEFLSHLIYLDNSCVVVAQHMSPTHRSMLVQLLSKATPFQVQEAVNAERLVERTIYITPPDNEITVSNQTIYLAKPHSNIGPKPSVDVLFESLARETLQVIAIILSGTGSDGSEGFNMLAQAGNAYLAVQDPASAKYDGMPNAAIQTGHVAKILPAGELGEHISEMLSHNTAPFPTGGLDVEKKPFEKIIAVLSKKSGTDFQNYKVASLTRRLEKRISTLNLGSLDRYLQYLEQNPEEIHDLFKVVLIGVTAFFRDKESFDVLESKLDSLVRTKKASDSIRVWVPGCSTGEEAYSIAILLHRLIKKYSKEQLDVQLFATDIDERAIAQGRNGVYAPASLENLPKEIVAEYFIPKGASYELIKPIRSMVLFSRHDLMRNPPFLKLDLISCRNLLIYFKNSLQHQLIPLFHFALVPSGFLFLGKSEAISTFHSLFNEEDAKHRLFRKKVSQGLQTIRFSALKPQTMPVRKASAPTGEHPVSIKEAARNTLLQALDTPYVVVNENHDIQEVHGDVRMFITLSEGGIQANLIKMLNSELQIEVRAVLTHVIATKVPIRGKIKRFRLFEHQHYVRIGVFPLADRGKQDSLFLVLFEKLDLEEFIHSDESVERHEAINPQIAELQEELNETKEQLQTYIEEIETSNEELQSLIEELQSTNEELQSTNEELETTNEELQSTNEEIQVAYMELKAAHELLEIKEHELLMLQANAEALLNNDLQAFVLVDNNYIIKKFNRQASRLFHELSGRFLSVSTLILDYLPEGETENFIVNFKDATGRKTYLGEKHFIDKSGQKRWLSVNYSPVLFKEEKVTGISLSFLDITSLKQTQSDLTKAEKLVSAVFNVVSMGISITDEQGIIVDVNDSYCELYGYTRSELIGKPFTILVPEKQRNKLQALHDRFMKTGVEDQTIEQALTKNGMLIDLEITSNRMIQPGKRFKITSVTDITLQKNTQKLLEEAQNMARMGAWQYFIPEAKLVVSSITREIYGVSQNFEMTVANGLSFYKEGKSRDAVTKAMTDCLKNGTPFDLELEFVSADGKEKWVRSIGRAFYHEGAVTRIHGSIQDITEKKATEEQIKESNQRFTYVTQATSDVIWDWDILSGKVHWGENYHKVFGEIPSLNLNDLENVHSRLHRRELPLIIQHAKDTLKSNETRWRHEHLYLKSDGTYAMVSNRAMILRTDDGKPIRVIGAMQDVTEQHYKERQKQLLQTITSIFNEDIGLIEALSQVIKHLGDFTELDFAEAWLLSTDRKTLRLVSKYSRTDAGKEFHDSTLDQTVLDKGQGLPGAIWESNSPVIWENVAGRADFMRSEAARKSGISASLGVPLLHKNQTVAVLTFGTAGNPDDLATFKELFAVLEEYLGGELRRKQLETELRQVIDTAPDLIGVINFEGRLIRINEAGINMLGYTADELYDKSFNEYIHPEDRERMIGEFAKLRQNSAPLNFENRFITSSGETIWIAWSLTSIPAEGICYAVGKDVTKQKSLQILLDNAYELARIGGWEFSLDDRIIRWTEVARQIHESEKSSLEVSEGVDFYHPDYKKFVAEKVKDCIELGEPFDFEAPIITSKGKERWVRSIGQAERINGRVTKIFGSIQDIHIKKTAELELRIFKQIIESSQDGIAIVGLNGQSSYINPIFSRNLGYTVQQLFEAGGPTIVFANQDIAQTIFSSLYAGNSWTGDVEIVHKDGKKIPYFLSAGPVRNEQGDMLAIYGIHTDISERIKSEREMRNNLQSLENYRFALDQSAIVALTDANGVILSINDKFCEISKYSREELIGNTHKLVNSGFHPKSFFADLWNTLTRGEVWQGVILNKAKDGSRYWVNSTIVPFLDEKGKPEHFLAIRFEITKQLEATDKLIRANKELEKLNTALKKRAHELALSNAELEQFAYVASHDLQEPLRMVSAFLAQLNKKYSDVFDEKAREYIHFALDGASRMRQIILDLLEFSRVGKQENQQSTVDLNDVVNEVSSLYRKLVEESGATIVCENLIPIQGFRSLLTQVMTNLIGNALKYRKANLEPKIVVACEERNNDYLIRVSDNGIGIEEEYFEKIFIIFQRLHDKTEYGGTGIGLAIVKKIIENMGGAIWVESKINEGTTFAFTLPKLEEKNTQLTQNKLDK